MPTPTRPAAPSPSASLPAPAFDPMVTHAVATARAMLARHGAGDWTLCFPNPRYDMIMLWAMEKAGAGGAWEALPGLGDFAQVSWGTDGTGKKSCLLPVPFGMLFNKGAGFAFLRLPVGNAESGTLECIQIIAAPTGELATGILGGLEEEIKRGRVNGIAPVSRIVGSESTDLDRATLEGEEPMLAVKTRDAVDREIKGFFSEAWRNLAEKNRIPHRRGVLLHGPPGNGKTSALRACLRAMPEVAAVFCRPTGSGDIGQTLEAAVDLWRRTAPAVLVIEDMDSLFREFPVSNFLNMLDGATELKEKGLLLVATTNHPEQLAPALSNRPGRFDTAIRFGPPDAALRRAYFQRELDKAEWAQLGKADGEDLVKATQRLSFAHLREIVIRSGLAAAGEGREGRQSCDLLAAAKAVAKGAFEADGGFKDEAEAFGFSGGGEV